MYALALDQSKIRDIAPRVLDHNQRLRILPTEFWATTTVEERALFCHYHGIYGIPTTELVEHLKTLIDGRKAIEIGAGHGVLASALNIPATDNRMQAKGKYKRIYQITGQPVIRYGRNVVDLDAHAAIRRYGPDVVIGSWVTHRYDPRRHWAGGNEIGVDEGDVLNRTKAYIFIGNEMVHRAKEIWDRPHTRTHHDFLYSRAHNGTPEFIAQWPGRLATE